jgi:hypothetical protein
MSRRVLWVAVAAVAVAFTGCGGDPMKRQPVRGTIQFQSKPIKYGSVRFEPADGQRTGASADIRDGSFSLDRASGLPAGKYKVWVQAFDRISEATAPPGSEGPPPKDILPAKYLNEPAGELDVKDVPDDKPNELKLDLK